MFIQNTILAHFPSLCQNNLPQDFFGPHPVAEATKRGTFPDLDPPYWTEKPTACEGKDPRKVSFVTALSHVRNVSVCALKISNKLSGVPGDL